MSENENGLIMLTADDGSEVTGPKTVEVATPLTRLPYFFRK